MFFQAVCLEGDHLVVIGQEGHLSFSEGEQLLVGGEGDAGFDLSGFQLEVTEDVLFGEVE